MLIMYGENGLCLMFIYNVYLYVNYYIVFEMSFKR